MKDACVIVKQTEPTAWVNSMVTVIKPEKIRVCIEPRDLNRAVKREHYPMKTIEEVVAGMPEAKVFSVLDATSGYWQMKLNEESSKLCTFNTPFGRYIEIFTFGQDGAVFEARAPCLSQILIVKTTKSKRI
jgi:hypothetical protein